MDKNKIKPKNIRIDSTTVILGLTGFVYAVVCGYILGVYAAGKELNLTYSGLFVFLGGFLLANGLFIKSKDNQ